MNWGKRTAAVSLAGLALVLTACPTAPTEPTEPSRNATPTAPSGPSLEAAAAAYEQIAEAFNATHQGPIGDLEEAQTLDEANAAWEEYLAIERTFLAGLEAIEFPDEAQEAADALVAAEEELVEIEEQLSTAEHDEAYFAAFEEWQAAVDSAARASDELREALGLGPAPGRTPVATPSASPTS